MNEETFQEAVQPYHYGAGQHGFHATMLSWRERLKRAPVLRFRLDVCYGRIYVCACVWCVCMSAPRVYFKKRRREVGAKSAVILLYKHFPLPLGVLSDTLHGRCMLI